MGKFLSIEQKQETENKKDSVLKLVIKEGDNINPALEEREYKYAYEINHSPRDYLCIDVWGAKNYLLKNWVS